MGRDVPIGSVFNLWTVKFIGDLDVIIVSGAYVRLMSWAQLFHFLNFCLLGTVLDWQIIVLQTLYVWQKSTKAICYSSKTQPKHKKEWQCTYKQLNAKSQQMQSVACSFKTQPKQNMSYSVHTRGWAPQSRQYLTRSTQQWGRDASYGSNEEGEVLDQG